MLQRIVPLRAFEDHKGCISAVAVFPDRRRMVTSSKDETILRLWDLKTGGVLKKMEGHWSEVQGLAVSRDGEFIASGDESGELIAWHGETGEPLIQPIKAHSSCILSLDFSPGGIMLATGSTDETTKLWSAKSWQLGGNPINCSDHVNCIRFSPSSELLAISTGQKIGIYNIGTRQWVANLKGLNDYPAFLSLAWTLDGTKLLSGGFADDATIREWDTTSTWKRVVLWTGHADSINAIAIHPGGALIASASSDHHVRLWRLSDRQTIATFKHFNSVECVTFSIDGKHILCGGDDKMIFEWAVPKDALPEEDASKEQVSKALILAINTTARNACITGDLDTAKRLFTQEIYADANNYISFANRSFVMARKLDWDHALQDATKSVSIQPSLVGCITEGIALCGKRQIRDAMGAFDLAFMCAHEDSMTVHFLLLIKAIALFNANEHDDAMLRVQELAAKFPNVDPLARRIVEAYLRVQLGVIALSGKLHKEAIDHFTAAINASTDFSKLPIHSMYKELTVLLVGENDGPKFMMS